ncbi:MAG TPA: GNAT family N-acetyltransferase [Mobilitalea sp.]|nr:GNAT family N-acetyltransferase [Mobilitalea sp.]
MDIMIRKYQENDISSMTDIWNTIVEEANAFPQVDKMTEDVANEFFSSQTFTGVALNGEEVVGLYILHPNNIGRCGHIANASYAVKRGLRGEKIGEKLVRDSLLKGNELGFSLMQFNAVVKSNLSAIHIYEKIGFKRLGVIPNGFHLGDGNYADIILFYIELG